jgi:hypothetical protein
MPDFALIGIKRPVGKGRRFARLISAKEQFTGQSEMAAGKRSPPPPTPCHREKKENHRC